MRLTFATALLWGAASLLNAHAAVVKRQDDSTLPTDAEQGSESPSATGPAAGEETSSIATDGGDTQQDTTIFLTETVTDDNVNVVTRSTTAFTTITTTVTLTTTRFGTTTITRDDQETATSTVYETTTVIVNEKRDLHRARALALAHARAPRRRSDAPASVPARTTAPPPAATAAFPELELHRARRSVERQQDIDKRAIITLVETLVVGQDVQSTALDTVFRTVVTTATDETTITRMVTETEQVGASTTVTVTSTLTVTSTAVQTGLQTGAPAASPSSDASSGDSSSSSGSNSDSSSNGGSSSGGGGGLSTGAKAGIGAGVGIVALAGIAGIAWFCIRRNRREKVSHDDFMGASEVPVGPSSSGHQPSMSQSTAGASAAPLSGNHGSLTSNTSPEGYRGTAMGDGRAGYAKPAYGAGYHQNSANRNSAYRSATLTSSENTHVAAAVGDGGSGYPGSGGASPHSQAAELASDSSVGRWHDPNTAEIDSQPVNKRPAQPTYEMPSTNF